MSRRFAIAAGNASASDRDLITTFLSGKGWKLWHWLPDLWLVVDMPDECFPQSLYNDIVEHTKITPQTHIVIFEIASDPFLYGGMANPAAWPWLTEIGGKTG